MKKTLAALAWIGASMATLPGGDNVHRNTIIVPYECGADGSIPFIEQ